MSDLESRLTAWASAKRSTRATADVDAALRPLTQSSGGRVCIAALREHYAAPSATLDAKLMAVRAKGVCISRHDFPRAVTIGLAVAAKKLGT